MNRVFGDRFIALGFARKKIFFYHIWISEAAL